MAAARRTLVDFVLLSGGESLGKVAGFVAFAYLARTLSTEGYGAVELAAGFAVFFSLMVDFGLGTMGARETARSPESAREHAVWIPSARLLLAIIGVPAMTVAPLLMGQPWETVQLVGLFSLSLLFFIFDQRWLFQGLERMRVVASAQLIRMTVFAATVLLVVHHEQDVLRVGMAEAGAAAVMAGYFLFHQRRARIPIGLAWPKEPLRHLFREASSVGLGQMIWAFNQQTPTFLIATFWASTQLAWFGSANRIYVSLSTFSMVYHFNLFPTFARLLRESKEAYFETVQASLRLSAWGGTLVALGLTVTAEATCALVFGEDFRAAGRPLAIMIWGLPLTLVSGHARWSLVAAGQQRYVLFAQIIGAVATAILGGALIPTWGVEGAALTNVGATLVVWGVAQRHAHREIGAIPFLSVVVTPALGVAAGLGVAHFVPNPWLGGIAAGVACCAVALLVDRALLGDLKRLAGARRGVT